MIDSGDEVVGGAKAKRAMADGLDLVVHSLDGAAGEAVLGPCQNPIEMPAEHAHGPHRQAAGSRYSQAGRSLIATRSQQKILVRFMEFDTAPCREGDEIGFVHVLEEWVML